MDFSFHLQQGQQLLGKRDASSITKALEHFKKANQLTHIEDIAKPKTLYFLALGNYLIGNIEQSYRIAFKAKRSIDVATENSVFAMGNMRELLGEDDIDGLISHISENFSQEVIFINNSDDDFDENHINFGNVNQLYETGQNKVVKPQFVIEDLSQEVLTAIFTGLSRNNDELIYFDKKKGDVLSYVEGYFSSLLGHQSIENRSLAYKIANGEPTDFVDEDRYLLIDRLGLSDFLNEYKQQANGKEPFTSYIEYFSNVILKDLAAGQAYDIKELFNGNYLQQQFHENFSRKHQNRILDLKDEYVIIFNNTTTSLAIKWTQENCEM